MVIFNYGINIEEKFYPNVRIKTFHHINQLILIIILINFNNFLAIQKLRGRDCF